jgi:16S rRNA C967 or C1407 C5-methylase (RsmB/RsmF family)
MHEEGYYYCLDFSSVFAAMTLSAIAGPVETVLDICSAPGGKGIFAWRMLRPERLICNEVIKKRTGVLIANLRRCGVGPVEVISADTSVLATAWPAMADVVMVDAPCSGQSLVARGKESPGCFHPATINMNANRQRRIIANSAATVAPGGYLAYMTCTYSEKENEGVLRWLLKQLPHFKPREVPALVGRESRLADFPCYRLFPQSGEGAGAFATLLRNEKSDAAPHGKSREIAVVWRSDEGATQP